MILAGLCALPASLTPELIGFADNASSQAQSAELSGDRTIQTAPTDAGKTITDGLKVHAVPASLRANDAGIAPVKAKAVLSSRSKADHSRKTMASQRNQPAMVIARNHPSLQEQYVTVREEVFFVVTQRTASGEQQSWQVHMYQVSVQPQAKITQKPRKI
jgi:hypothetical protein